MKKIISQITLILLIISIGISSVFITKVNATSRAGLNVSSATEGGTFTVSLIIDSNIIDASATITVTYSDGTTATKKLVYAEGMGDDFKNLVSFPAKVAGETKIKATNIYLSDNSPTPVVVEDGGTKEQVITIKSNAPANPENTSTSNSVNNTTQTPATPNNTATETPKNNTTNTSNNTNTVEKEPEIVNPTFKDVNEKVYVLKGANVRSSCSTAISSNKIGGLAKGQSVTRTGYDKEWSRILYNGKTAYVATSLLTTEEPVKEENTVKNTTENTVASNKTNSNNITSNKTNNQILNQTDNNAIDKNEILGNIENEIGVLPEVGKNIADYMFVIVSVISLVIVMFINYKEKSNSI